MSEDGEQRAELTLQISAVGYENLEKLSFSLSHESVFETIASALDLLNTVHEAKEQGYTVLCMVNQRTGERMRIEGKDV